MENPNYREAVAQPYLLLQTVFRHDNPTFYSLQTTMTNGQIDRRTGTISVKNRRS